LTEELPAEGALSKGLRLLVALGNHPDGAGVSELAREVELPVSTTHRLLTGMIPQGFVAVDPERRQYFLGLRTFELSQRVASARKLSAVALPAMQRVTQATGEPTLLAVLAEDEILYVERVEGKHLAQIRGSAGERGSLYGTALGKALLAFLPEEEREILTERLPLPKLGPKSIADPDELRAELDRTRERGYAVNDEEPEAGVRAIGVPIIKSRGRPAASIAVATLTFRYSMEELEKFVLLLQDAAREISVQLP
jgi:IclR family transcriptional regulator, acetate operon repressor